MFWKKSPKQRVPFTLTPWHADVSLVAHPDGFHVAVLGQPCVVSSEPGDLILALQDVEGLEIRMRTHEVTPQNAKRPADELVAHILGGCRPVRGVVVEGTYKTSPMDPRSWGADAAIGSGYIESGTPNVVVGRFVTCGQAGVVEVSWRHPHLALRPTQAAACLQTLMFRTVQMMAPPQLFAIPPSPFARDTAYLISLLPAAEAELPAIAESLREMSRVSRAMVLEQFGVLAGPLVTPWERPLSPIDRVTVLPFAFQELSPRATQLFNAHREWVVNFRDLQGLAWLWVRAIEQSLEVSLEVSDDAGWIAL